VTANQQDNTVSVFLSLGNGSFTPALSLPTGNAPVALASGDFNGDARRDLVASNRASSSVTLTLNSTTIPVSPNAPLTSYPASQYIDVGLKVNATPRIHPNDEVTLKLQFEISALSGQSANGIPIIGNRVVEQVVRLRENQTSILGGMIESNEAHAITGPATAIGGSRNNTQTDTELLIAITPRQIRLGPHAGRTLYAGRGAGAAPAAPPAPGQFQPGESNVPPPNGQPGPGAPGAPGFQPNPGGPLGPGPAPGVAPAPGPPGPNNPVNPGTQPGGPPENQLPPQVQPLPVPGPPTEQGPG
jgi:hypothetical protein